MSNMTFILVGNAVFAVLCTVAVLPLFFYNKKK